MKKLLLVLWVSGVVFITAAFMLWTAGPVPARAASAYQVETPMPQVTVVLTQLVPNTGADPGPQNVFFSGWAILIFLGVVALLVLLALLMRPAPTATPPHHHDTHDDMAP